MVQVLEQELVRRNIDFHAAQRRIRCFPHIVNLACKAVITMLENEQGYIEDEDECDPLMLNPIERVRALVRSVSYLF